MDTVFRKMPVPDKALAWWTVVLIIIMALSAGSAYWSWDATLQTGFMGVGEYPRAQLSVLQTEVIDHVEDGGGQMLAFSTNKEQQKANVLFAASSKTVEEVVASVALTQANRVGLEVQTWDNGSSVLTSLTLHLDEEHVDSLRQEAVDKGLLSAPLLAVTMVVAVISSALAVLAVCVAVELHIQAGGHRAGNKRKHKKEGGT